jgi:arginine dihydrolase
MSRLRSPARFLMCRPEHFAVAYAINPWMNPADWARDDRALCAASRLEWQRLYETISGLGARTTLLAPAAGLPDLVFTANAAIVLDGKALLARFRHAERQREEPHFAATFHDLQRRGLVTAIRTLPDDIVLEGAGDCVWDETRALFWMGYGPRSDAAARSHVKREFGVDTIALKLADARFYHMDTALCPLSHGDVIYYPAAFTRAGRNIIRERVQAEQRIEIGPADARRLAANAVCLDDTVVVSGCSDALRGRLEERGYRVIVTPLDSFLRSGGSAFCLTLRLDRRSNAADAAIKDHAA